MLGWSWWVTDLLNSNPVMLVSWVYWVIFSIVLHELAHGWAALACGDRTPIETGHMTWNPLVHMGPVSLLMFALAGIAWGLMPVDPSRFRRRYDDAIVSGAGPAMNLLLAGTSVGLYTLWIGIAGGFWFTGVDVGDVLYRNVQIFLRVGMMLNLTLCALNLLPIPPLDGSRIVGTFVPGYRRWATSEQGMQVAVVGMIIVFMWGGGPIFRAAGNVADRAMSAAQSLVGAKPPP